MLKIFSYKKNNGFTIMELLVTVAILAIFATMVMISLNGDRPVRTVEKSARQFYNTLVYARNLSQTGAVFQDEDSDGDVDVPNGYGVSITSAALGTYVLFGDTYTASTPAQYDGPGEAVDPVVILDAGVAMALYDLTGVPFGSDALDLFFETSAGTLSLAPSSSGIRVEFYALSDPTIKQTVVIVEDTVQMYVE